ncbi:MAG: TatD family hydrolase [Oscillospiraceae bacterium]|nr:TatD family hydrolase [Oscillospiraceae bacterium]
MLFDTHTHFDDRQFNPDRHEIIRSLPEYGVGLALCPGCDIKSSRNCVALAEEYDHIYAAVGTHPHDAKSMTDEDLREYEALASHPKVKAIGEIGLDYHYDFSPRDVQKFRFVQQMKLAKKVGLPVIIHDREAHGDCLEIVKKFPDIKGVYHCYSGSLEDAKVLVGMGWYLSFTGVITYPNARKALEIIEWMPMDRIMIETDSPYLAPVPQRGKRNDSRFVGLVRDKIAQVKGISVEEAERITTENGKRFFSID